MEQIGAPYVLATNKLPMEVGVARRRMVLRNVTLGDLNLALRDLLGEKLTDLRRSKTGKLYEPRLRAKQKEIEAIPEAQTGTAPFANELGEADSRHDGYGSAIFSFCAAIEAHPKLAGSLKDAAREAQATFVPALGMLQAPFADEAYAALENRSELGRFKAHLKLIPTPGGGSLYDWVKAFLDAGDDIDKLLRQRAKAVAITENASATGPLRGATVGLLGRFRNALRDEIEEEGSKLGDDYDARLFAYLDKLSAERAARLGGPVEEAPADPGVSGEHPAQPKAPQTAA
jgi:hypothetical protein